MPISPSPRHVWPLLALPIVLVTGPVSAAPQPQMQEHQVVMPAAGPYLIKLANLRGRVVLRSWDKNVVFIRVTKQATRELGEAERALLDNATTAIAQPETGQVSISTEWPGDRRKGGGYGPVLLGKLSGVFVDYVVCVPTGSAIEVKQEYGPILAYGVSGRLDLFTRDGDLTLSGVTGWAEAANERGRLNFSDIDGDAIARSMHGPITCKGVTGDIKAATSTGEVRIDVTPRFSGEVTFHTVSGEFRSDLATFQTDLQPGDKGYVGVLRGPLARKDPPVIRYRIDTSSGTATIASERATAR